MKMKKIIKFVCESCGRVYDNENDIRKCCSCGLDICECGIRHDVLLHSKCLNAFAIDYPDDVYELIKSKTGGK